MKVLNYGSLNIDYVYKVDSFVVEGETKSSLDYNIFAGGKGLNQSVAMSKAGLDVYHAGKIGKEGMFLKDILDKAKVNTNNVVVYDKESGHAIIQVDTAGRNCILLHGGANQNIEKDEIDKMLTNFSKGDLLMLQNEVSNIGYIIDRAYEKGMVVAINPAPMNDKVLSYPLDKVSILMVNEIEGKQLTGVINEDDALDAMIKKYPKSTILMTLGKDGSICYHNNKTYRQGIYKVKAIDTTSAGDTFCGYFVRELLNNQSIEKALDFASKASAICVSKAGAAVSIPTYEEVLSTKL